MKKTIVSTIIGLSALAGLASSCASNSGTATANTSAAANRATAAATNAASSANTAANAAAPKSDDDAPAAVKAAFSGAQSFTTQHKDITAAQVAEIEKDAGVKVPETDHHSYLAFSTSGGARKQIGAATVVKANGKDVIIIYDSKNGVPTIREVRAEAVPAQFLAQFAGKGHDNEFVIGSDIKISGADQATAKAITEAVRVDALTMQTLYGAAHSH